MDLPFSYNSAAFADSINCANKASMYDTIGSSISKICKDAIPADFAGISILTSTLTNVSNTMENVAVLPNKLQNIQNILDAVASDSLDSGMISTLINSNMRMVKASDLGLSSTSLTDGYIFVPDCYSDVELKNMSLPMLVYIGGAGRYDSYSSIFNGHDGLPHQLQSGGLGLDALVYIPCMPDCFKAVHSGDIQANVEKIAEIYNVDTDRISAMGMSDGGRAVLKLAELNPNYYSTVVAAGANYEWGVGGDVTNSPDTKFIFACGTADGSISDVEKITQSVNEKGGQAVCYKIDGAGHDDGCRDVITEALITDVLNAKKSVRASSEVLGEYEVSLNDYRSASIILNGKDSATDATYYHPLSDGKVTKADAEKYIAKQMAEVKTSDKEIKLTLVDNSGNIVQDAPSPSETIKIDDENEEEYIEKDVAQNPTPDKGSNYGYSGGYTKPYVNPSPKEQVTIDPTPSEPLNPINPVIEPVVEKETTRESSEIVNRTINNYYYNNSNNDEIKTSEVDVSNTELEPVEIVEPVEITEPVDVEPVVVETTEPDKVVVTPTYVNTTTEKTNIWPAIGAVAGIAGAAVGAKILYDKVNEEKEEEYEPIPEPNKVPYGYGSNYDPADLNYKPVTNQTYIDNDSYYDDTSFNN